MKFWIAIPIVVLLITALDLGVFRRKGPMMKTFLALAWTVFWTALGLGMVALIHFMYRDQLNLPGYPVADVLVAREAAWQYLGVFLVGKTLSLGNVLAIALVFSFFRVPAHLQHRVLFWGLLGMLVLRGLALWTGTVLHPLPSLVLGLMGMLIMVAGVKLYLMRHDNLRPARNLLVRVAEKTGEIEDGFEDRNLLKSRGEGLAYTLMLKVLLLVISMDVLFAASALPGGWVVSRDSFLVHAAHLMSLFGLRSMYFAIAGLMPRIRHLKICLAIVLLVLGILALLHPWYAVPAWSVAGFILVMMSAGSLSCLFVPQAGARALVSPLATESEDLAAITLKQARKIVVLILGSSTVLLGIALIVLPGPAFLVIPAGFAILSTEFVWARRWLRKFKAGTHVLRRRFFSFRRPK